jgi:hypothetical protein
MTQQPTRAAEPDAELRPSGDEREPQEPACVRHERLAPLRQEIPTAPLGLDRRLLTG